MVKQTTPLTHSFIPAEGIEFAVSPGKGLTRIHLDMGQDGVSLAAVGAASAALASKRRQVVRLKRSQDGITLSVVGAASAAQARG